MQASIYFLERIDEVLKAVTNNPATYYQVDANRHIHKFIVNKYPRFFGCSSSEKQYHIGFAIRL